MAKQKYYAIAKGKKTGIFTNWNECKSYIAGFSGAVYKSFFTVEEAEDYINSYSVPKEPNSPLRCYVDGSFKNATKEFSYGLVVLENNEEKYFFHKYNNEKMASMRNVAGEIYGAMTAMDYAVKNNCTSVDIFFDYEGIEKWALGLWQANKNGTIKYKEYFNKIKDKVNINFFKVEAHTGDKYNEIADSLAKQALGIPTPVLYEHYSTHKLHGTEEKFSTAIILAGGKGLRMGGDVPKQFLKIKNRTILEWTIEKFQNSNVDEIVIVGIKEHLKTIETMIKNNNFTKATIVEGGETRQASVYNGLLKVEKGIVLIHDGVRPFIDVEEINNLINITMDKKAVCTGTKSKDTVKIVGENLIIEETLPREKVFNVQTPQCFALDLIMEAHHKSMADNFVGTDDSSLVERMGISVYMHEGSYKNIKITTKEDLQLGWEV
ncbi:MAG: 2-C-methyl-D-erythritol 4-phosphate cytidylyltransferase [Lachnospirales bacterium]